MTNARALPLHAPKRRLLLDTGSGTSTEIDGTANWDNGGDTAYLRDAAGEAVDAYTY
ncbi:MAG TPA: hypothetical protein PKZ84_06860 [Anaerolineae bacterium]|nr:hypothetical protein [Anaerolineae bacterium]HQI83408.1 hypothetical protein [Anaerolineae bacterium]